MKSSDICVSTRLQLVEFLSRLRCVQCNHCVKDEWSSYDGNVYCQACWDINKAEEERDRQEEMTRLKQRLAELEGAE